MPIYLACAYASHGDTKHVLLLPEDPHECFEFGALAFDLADRLQTPIFVMLDLDIGMNERLRGRSHGTTRASMDRGKVMTAEELEAGREFRPLSRRGRRRHSLPHLSRHPPDKRGSFFTRGTSKRSATRATPRRARPTTRTCSGCCGSSRPRQGAGAGARSRKGRA